MCGPLCAYSDDDCWIFVKRPALIQCSWIFEQNALYLQQLLTSCIAPQAARGAQISCTTLLTTMKFTVHYEHFWFKSGPFKEQNESV